MTPDPLDGPRPLHAPAPTAEVPVTLVPNGMATGGMVLGIIAAAIVLIPFLGLIALPVALVGTALSGVGFARSRQPGVAGRGAAIAGLACSIISIIVWGFVILAGFVAIGSAA